MGRIHELADTKLCDTLRKLGRTALHPELPSVPRRANHLDLPKNQKTKRGEEAKKR